MRLILLLPKTIPYLIHVIIPVLWSNFLFVLFSFAGIYQYLGVRDLDGQETNTFVECMYFNVVTLRSATAIIPTAEALLGYVFLGVMAAVLLDIFSRQKQSGVGGKIDGGKFTDQ